MKKLLLILGAVITFCAVVPYALALTPQFQYDTLGTLTTGLQDYYNMQGNSNDYYGTVNGTDTSMSYSTSTGKVNEGAGFGGSGVINFGAHLGISFGVSTTIAFWFKGTSPANFAQVIGRTNAFQTVSNVGWGLTESSNDSNTLYFEVSNGSSANALQTHRSALPIFDGNWHLFTLVIPSNGKAAGVQWWVDGSQYTGGTLFTDYDTWSSTPSYAVNATMGNTANSSQTYLNADVDEVGIWTKALSSAEIAELYNAGAGQTMCNGTGGPVCAGGSSPKMSFNWITLNWKPEPIA